MRCREKKHNSLIKTTSIFPEHGQKMSMSRYQYRIVTKQSFDKGLLPIIFEGESQNTDSSPSRRSCHRNDRVFVAVNHKQQGLHALSIGFFEIRAL